jgi:hypothetical protein
MKLTAAAALLASLALTLGCSSNNAPLMHDAGGDKNAGDAPKDVPADMTATDAPADMATTDAPADMVTTDAPAGDAADGGSDAGDAKLDGPMDATTISDGPVCPADASTATDASGICADHFMLQLAMHPTDEAKTVGAGTCGGYHVWLSKTPAGTTVCLYDLSQQTVPPEKLLGVVQSSGAMLACSGRAIELPAKCAELSTFAPPPKPDPSPELDGGADAPPNPALEASLKTGLVALWTLDGDGKDRSGHGLDLTVAPELSYVAGRHGMGLKFVGDNTKTAKRPIADPSLVVQRGDFTISLWVNLDPNVHDNQGFAENGNNWALGTPGPGSAWILQTDVGGVAGAGAADGFGGWRHIVAERQGPILSLYMSGVLVNNGGGQQNVNENPTAPTPYPFKLGTWINGSLPLTGALDDVAVWNRALTAEERAYTGTHPVPVVP